MHTYQLIIQYNWKVIWNFCNYFESEFITKRAKERNITLPVPDPVNQLEKWLHNQKKTASQKDPANGYAMNHKFFLKSLLNYWFHIFLPYELSMRQGFFYFRVDKGKNWKVFDFCNMFLQTFSELEEATVDLLQRLRKENVFYAEIRFCPSLHTLESLSSEDALLAVMKGKNLAFQSFFIV